MKFSENWLRQWVNPDITTDTLCEQLTMAGLEVDSVSTLADDFSGVIVAEVVACQQHPNADKLRVCKVNVGKGEPVPVVCGASNVRVGLKVAFATVGAKLPGDFKIKKSKLRGESSHGMICAASELGITDANETSKGIVELSFDAPIGTDIREYLKLDEKIIDIELTPNRGDCASICGIAREVGVLNDLPITPPAVTTINTTINDVTKVKVKEGARCPRYVARIIKGIDTKAQTPQWMRALLEQSGVRCIHPVVDVCNYVMLELGQPMHGFDLSKLEGEISIRCANANEKIKLLDEQEVTLLKTDLVIADAKGVEAIAGVMGGFDSGVTATTRDVLLESAFFEPVGISLTARRLGLTTDASYRFERGVDFQQQVHAIERATALLIDIAGGSVAPIIEVVDEKSLPKPVILVLRRARIARLLGIEIKDAEVMRILKALGMGIDTHALGWVVSVPSYRFDITQEVDLIEELARIYGYNNIPTHQLEVPMVLTTPLQNHLSISRLADFLVDRGYRELVTYSFTDSKKQQLVTPKLEAVRLQNPISSDMDVMRTSLWPGLLQTMCYNQNRQITRQRLFETGQCFWRDGKEIVQQSFVGLLAVGDVYPEQWGESTRRVDFYDMKGDVEMLLGLAPQINLRWQPGTHPALHPGQSADIYCGDLLVGYLGLLHPSLLKPFDLRQAPVLMQLRMDLLEVPQKTQYEQISKFPAMRRDLALVVDQAVTAADLIKHISAKSGEILQDTQVFDLYQGEGIEKGKKSIALGLTFQDPSRTLIEADINSIIQNIINVLKDELNATLRT